MTKSEETLETNIRRELASLIYRQNVIAGTGSVACALVVAWGLRDTQSFMRLFIPVFALIILLNILRAVWTIRFHKDQSNLSSPNKWLNRIVVLDLLAGFGWGMTSFALPELGLFEQGLVIIVLAGLVCGATVTFAPHFPAALAFNLSSMGLLAISYAGFFSDFAYAEFSLLIIVFASLMSWLAYNLNRNIVKSLRLQFENANLIAQLNDKNEHLLTETAEKQRNVEELKHAKDEYEKLYRDYDRMLENLPIGVMRIDRNLRVQYINDALRKIAGVPDGQESATVGQILTDVSSTSSPMHIAAMEHLKQKQEFSISYEHTSTFGKVATIQVIGVPIVQHDQFDGAILLIDDISERKLAERKLIEAKKIADSANNAKSVFLASMSHELRTPLHGIIGLSDLLSSTSLDDGQKNYLDLIRRSANNLLQTVNHVLDLTRIEKGKFAVQRGRLDLRELVEQETQMHTARAAEKKLQLTADIDDDLPAGIVSDEYILRHILQNLIGNAIKFTDKGGISVSVRCMSRNDEKINLSIKVKDTGIGIPKDKLEEIFKPFVQLETGTSRRYQGAGLGMAIAKQLAHSLNGDIRLESEVGRGSTFELTFDASLPSPEENAIREQSERDTALIARKLKVLVVDDNEVNRMIAVKLLQKYGCDVVASESGFEALEKIQHTEFDLVLMDIDMPDMDGLETARRIRSTSTRSIPIIAMTAHTMSGDRERFLDAGMDDFIGKPFNYQQLVQTVSQFARH